MSSPLLPASSPAHGAADPVNLGEYEAAARALISPMAFDYIAGGADDELTLQRNRAAFGRYLLRPRILGGVEAPNLATTVLGEPLRMPIMLAPTGFHRLAHDQGELASARAAGNAGTILVASTASTHSLEETAAAATGSLWFQLYAYRDRQLTAALVRRAEAAGCKALCLTADTPVVGRRERDVRGGFALPAGMQWGNFTDSERSEMPPLPEGSSLTAYIASQFYTGISWADIGWLKSLSSLPRVLKGVMCAEDAVLAVEHGAAAIIVSNHGGPQLDSAPGAIEVLDEVVQAVAGRCEVLLDGGVRRGTDVLKALAIGARAVLIGRPYVWGLAVDGEAGIQRVLDLLTAELITALHLCGCPDVRTVSHSILMEAPRL